MKVWQCYDAFANQAWYLTGDGRIAVEGKGQCLDLPGGSIDPGNVIQTWECGTGESQARSLVGRRRGRHVYMIRRGVRCRVLLEDEGATAEDHHTPLTANPRQPQPVLDRRQWPRPHPRALELPAAPVRAHRHRHAPRSREPLPALNARRSGRSGAADPTLGPWYGHWTLTDNRYHYN